MSILVQSWHFFFQGTVLKHYFVAMIEGFWNLALHWSAMVCHAEPFESHDEWLPLWTTMRLVMDGSSCYYAALIDF